MVGVLPGAAMPGNASGCALTMRFMVPWRYSITSRERWRATAAKPIFWSSAPKAWGCDVAYSMNSMPSIPRGLEGSGMGSLMAMEHLVARGGCAAARNAGAVEDRDSIQSCGRHDEYCTF